ncbi:hypothetical protein PLESTM_001439500 [Pleodorina starrii]|nr:hypothetical protein PLESTM_001439500 [Pleodorina starrii]
MLARGLLAAAREGLNVAPSMTRSISTVKLPDMPYDYGALEPYISGHIMELHHTKHHAAYVANLNKALEQQAEAEAKGDVSKIISLQSAIKFNGGGHINHDIFWTNLIPAKDFAPPSGELKAQIEAQWKSLDNFIATFSAQTAAVQVRPPSPTPATTFPAPREPNGGGIGVPVSTNTPACRARHRHTAHTTSHNTRA